MLGEGAIFRIIMEQYFDNEYTWENIEKAWALLEKEDYTIIGRE